MIEGERRKMIKIESGIIKKILTEEQYELINKNLLESKDIVISDTIQSFVKKDGNNVEYLPIRITKKDVDKDGNEKYVYNKEKNEYVTSYSVSKVLYAYGKEMRIILELGEYHPVKIAYDNDNKTGTCKILCIQDQSTGLLD